MDLSQREPIPDLSPRLRECLLFIAWFFLKNGMYPTQNEIARGIGLSKKTRTATGYVDPLIKKGFLVKASDSGKRNLRLTPLADRVITEKDIKEFNRKQK